VIDGTDGCLIHQNLHFFGVASLILACTMSSHHPAATRNSQMARPPPMTPMAIAKAKKRLKNLKERDQRRQAKLQQQLDEWFAKFDSNGDGSFERSELRVLFTHMNPNACVSRTNSSPHLPQRPESQPIPFMTPVCSQGPTERRAAGRSHRARHPC
jgi:hypothetical protein